MYPVQMPSRIVRRNIFIATIPFVLVILIMIVFGLSYDWYGLCKDNLQTVTCVVTNCTYYQYNADNNIFNVNLTYRYVSLKLSVTDCITVPSITDYCRYVHPINSTLSCAYDSRNAASTLGSNFDCQTKNYTAAMIFSVLLAALLILGSIAMATLMHNKAQKEKQTDLQKQVELQEQNKHPIKDLE